jgi:predicted alpha/beta-hydrolase family hydrolase
MTDFLFDGPSNAPWTIALAHGAGAPMDSPFMDDVATGLAGHGLRVVRFEFPYMAGRRVDGKKRGPDRPAVLQDCWHTVIAELDPDRLIIGGKSMGGRIASLVADAAGVAGLVCYGYPFHPPGRPEKTRTEHLAALATPTLICQGTRDSFGTPEDIAGYALSPAIRLHWLEDGDHSFKPRKASGRTAAQNIDEAIAATAAFAAGR